MQGMLYEMEIGVKPGAGGHRDMILLSLHGGAARADDLANGR